ncbi:MAG: hypothetical protein Q9166_007390 [cf. Caloplaca sp. 2 TL-2023]
MTYYSISAILTSAQKVPCTFDLPIPNLGFLDDNPGGDIQPHQPLLLPLYLAELLAVQQFPVHSSSSSSQPLLTLDLPTSLSPRVLNALKADAKSVDLRSLEVFFYEGASRILELLEEEGVGDVLCEAFKKRAAEIADHARNARGGAGGGEGEGFLRGLDEWERGLFRAAHDGSKAVRMWMGEVKGGK